MAGFDGLKTTAEGPPFGEGMPTLRFTSAETQKETKDMYPSITEQLRQQAIAKEKKRRFQRMVHPLVLRIKRRNYDRYL